VEPDPTMASIKMKEILCNSELSFIDHMLIKGHNDKQVPHSIDGMTYMLDAVMKQIET
jgi:hypothetical protein